MPKAKADKNNEERIADFEARMAEDDKKEEEQKASAKLFDPEELMRESSDILEITDEVLGTIKYGKLSMKEFNEFRGIQNPEDKAYHMLHLMLRKAYPKLKYEDLEQMPFDKIARLSNVLSREITRFLPKPP